MTRLGVSAITTLALGFAAFGIATPAQAAWWDAFFANAPQTETEREAPPEVDSGGASAGALNGDTIARGLRAALEQGMTDAIARLGQENGFWQNDAARIPVPQSLRGPVTLMREAGMGGAVDAFHRSLNRAAEAAVPAAADIFSQALQTMPLRDAQSILAGGEQAATRYFRQRTETELAQAFRPIVSERIAQAGVGSAYKAMVAKAGPYAAVLGAPEDLDGYVTSQTLDALFNRIAEEETRIRNSAAARGSEVLREVFGNRDAASSP